MAYQHHHDITDTIVNSLTHALVNGSVFKMFHGVSIGVALVIAGVGVAALWVFSRKRL